MIATFLLPVVIAMAAASDADFATCNAQAPPLGASDRQAFMLRCLDERARARKADVARLTSKPGAALGMTPEQVIKETAWGKPKKVNRTVTATGVHEQWVYAGGFLYFDNSRLTAIQN